MKRKVWGYALIAASLLITVTGVATSNNIFIVNSRGWMYWLSVGNVFSGINYSSGAPAKFFIPVMLAVLLLGIGLLLFPASKENDT